jgi:hypothetical protein
MTPVESGVANARMPTSVVVVLIPSRGQQCPNQTKRLLDFLWAVKASI